MTTESESSPASPSPSRGSFVRDVLPALLWTVIVSVLGGIPNPAPPIDLGFQIDKVEHAAAFAILQVLALRALRYELPGVLPRGMPWAAAGASIVVGAALELYQVTVPNRSAEVMDLVWDAVGAGIAAWVTAWVEARRQSSGPDAVNRTHSPPRRASRT
jgi:VanZ family protein